MSEWVKTETRPGNGTLRERSMADVLKDIIGNVQEIVRGEVRLAKTEAKAEAAKAFTSARLIVVGATLAFFGIGYVLLAIVYALSLAIPAWAAAACVGIVLAVVAASVISAGMNKWKLVHATPEKTVETIEENLQWMKNQAK